MNSEYTCMDERKAEHIVGLPTHLHVSNWFLAHNYGQKYF